MHRAHAPAAPPYHPPAPLRHRWFHRCALPWQVYNEVGSDPQAFLAAALDFLKQESGFFAQPGAADTVARLVQARLPAGGAAAADTPAAPAPAPAAAGPEAAAQQAGASEAAAAATAAEPETAEQATAAQPPHAAAEAAEPPTLSEPLLHLHCLLCLLTAKACQSCGVSRWCTVSRRMHQICKCPAGQAHAARAMPQFAVSPRCPRRACPGLLRSTQ